MGTITLLHGSEQIVEVPALAFGNDHNDYGRGFYCTKVEEMAKEWACKSGKDGFVNRYILDDEGFSAVPSSPPARWHPPAHSVVRDSFPGSPPCCWHTQNSEYPC